MWTVRRAALEFTVKSVDQVSVRDNSLLPRVAVTMRGGLLPLLLCRLAFAPPPSTYISNHVDLFHAISNYKYGEATGANIMPPGGLIELQSGYYAGSEHPYATETTVYSMENLPLSIACDTMAFCAFDGLNSMRIIEVYGTSPDPTTKPGVLVLHALRFSNGFTAKGDGGALYISGGAFVSVVSCQFVDNWAFDGGAIYVGTEESVLDVYVGLFEGNACSQKFYRDDIYSYEEATVTLHPTCPPGYRGTSSFLGEVATFHVDASVSVAGPRGTYEAVCVPCELSFGGTVGKCDMCPNGTIGLGYGLGCVGCGPGRFNPVVNSTSFADCRECSPGTANKAQGAAMCGRCGKGSFANKPVNATACVQCSAGTYLDRGGAVGNTSCVDCGVNSVSSIGSISEDNCTLCGEGGILSDKRTSCARGDDAMLIDLGSGASLRPGVLHTLAAVAFMGAAVGY